MANAFLGAGRPAQREAPTDEALLERIDADQEEKGQRNPYQRLARYYGVEEDNPKLYMLAGKLMAKGLDPNEWLDQKIGTGGEPTPRKVEPIDPRGMRTSVEPPAEEVQMQESGPIRRYVAYRDRMHTPEQLKADARGMARGADRVLGRIPSKIGERLSGKSLAPTEAEDRERSPYAESAGSITAAFPAGGLAAKPVQAALNPLVQLATRGRALGALAGAGEAALTVPVVGGTLAGVDAASDAMSGDDRAANIPQRAWEGAKLSMTPMNMLVAAALGGAGGYAKGLRRSNSQTGEDIRLREEFGGSPSVTRGATGGAFDEPGIANRRGTSADVGAISRESNDAVLGRLRERAGANEASYGQRRAEFLATPAGQTPVDVTDDVNLAIREIEGNAQIPLATRQATTQTILRELTDDELLKPFWKNGRLVVPPEMLNKVRQRFDDLAKTNEPIQDNIMRGTAEKLRDVEDKTGWLDVKQPYAEEAENLKRGHQLLGLKGATKTKATDIAASKKGARTMRRSGENTVTGGLESPDVAEFLERFPELRNQVFAPRLLAAKNRLSFGVPEGGTLYSRMSGLPMKNLEPLEANVLGPAAQAVGRAAPHVAGGGNAIVNAYIEQQRRNEEMARLLRNGGR